MIGEPRILTFFGGRTQIVITDGGPGDGLGPITRIEVRGDPVFEVATDGLDYLINFLKPPAEAADEE